MKISLNTKEHDIFNKIRVLIRNWHSRFNEAAREIDLVLFFIACLSIFSMIGLLSLLIASEYFQQDSFISVISYKSAERPAGLLPSMYPSPFGVHYFGDFLDTLSHSRVSDPFNTPGMSPVGYPLFSLLVIAPFQMFDYHTSLKIYLATTALILFIPLWRFGATRTISERFLIVASLLMSAPLLSTFDRGNIQGLVVGFSLLGLLAYWKDRQMQAGFWFAIAASMKVYPVLLLLLLVRSRNWKALGLSTCTGLFVTWLSFQFFEGGIISNSQDLWDSVTRFRSDSIDVLTSGNHSFRGGFAALAVQGPNWFRGTAESAVTNYNFLLLFALLVLSFLIIQRTTSFLNSVIYLSLLLSYGLGISLSYMPLFLILAVAMIIAGESDRTLSSMLAMGGIALLLAPKGVPECFGIPLYVIFDPAVALAILLLLVPQDLRRSFRSSQFILRNRGPFKQSQGSNATL